MKTVERIDTHQHFWRLSRGDYGWLAPTDLPNGLEPIRRDFMPEDLAPLLAANKVRQTVLVQATDTVAETEFMLALASQHDWIAGVVGWVDLQNTQSIAQLEAWSAHPKFKGVRPMLQDIADPHWISHAPHDDVVRALIRLGLRFDALVLPQHLEPLLGFVRKWPELPVVVDHAAKPAMAKSWDAPWVSLWQSGMQALSAEPHICCKLSGMLTETGRSARSTADAQACTRLMDPAWQTLLRLFGPTRLMWGSDWPVLNLAADYAGWIAIASQWLQALSEDEQAQIWGHNASRFYNLSL